MPTDPFSSPPNPQDTHDPYRAASPYGPPNPQFPYGTGPVDAPIKKKHKSARLVAATLITGLILGGGVGGVIGGSVASMENRSTTSSTESVPTTSSNLDTTPAAASANLADIADKVLPSVVSIQAASASSLGTGSGVVIKADGYILTNNHVVADAARGGEITVTLQDGSELPAKIVGRDEAFDLAVIKVNQNGLVPVAFAGSSSLKVGNEVLAIGSPLGLSGTVTSGIISALDRPVNTGDGTSDVATTFAAIQTDAAINPGNSGGALVDGSGRVIGINSAIATLGTTGESGSIGVGFAIPADQAKRIADELIADGKATHPVMGISVSAPSTNETAAVVANVVNGSPADAAGLKVGDRIISVDSRRVDSPTALIAFTRLYEEGQTIPVVLERNGKEQTVDLTLTSSE